MSQFSAPSFYPQQRRRSLNDGLLGYPGMAGPSANTAPNFGTQPDPRAVPNSPSISLDAPFTGSPYQHVSAPLAPYAHSYGRPAAPSARSDDYLPPGYQAPSPAYADSMNRVDEAATDRTRRSNNFYDSVQRNNGRMPTAPTYLITGAGRSAPGIVPLPPGSNVLGPTAPIAAPKPSPAPKGYSQQEYIANPNFDESQPVSTTNQKYTLAHRTKTIATPEQTAAGNQAGASMFMNGPSTDGQPSQPAAPPQPQNAKLDVDAGTKRDIPISEQIARTMFGAIKQQNPQLSDGEAVKVLSHRLTTQYGVDQNAVEGMFAKELEAGQSPVTSTQGRVQRAPDIKMPLSMLGPSSQTGYQGQRAAGIGQIEQKQAAAGPSITIPGASSAGQPGAMPGATPLQQEGSSQVVRTGSHNGRRVVQYSDGSVVYAE